MTKSLIAVGTGRHTSALMAEGYSVKAVALVKRNIDILPRLHKLFPQKK